MQDFTSIRNKLIDKCADKAAVNKRYVFFYDETNNYRVFRIKNGKFNESPKNYFVLGGICIKTNEMPDFLEVERELQLSPSLNEIKSRHIINGKNFMECMNEKRLNIILKWIDQNDIFLHVEAVDHLKIIAKDLCEMCCINDEGERMICENLFYNCIKNDVGGIQNILVQYGYPNIENNQLKEFLRELKNFVSELSRENQPIDKIGEMGKEIFWYMPINAIDRAIKNNSSFKVRDEIISNYVPYYIVKPLLFLNSKHIYDEEPRVKTLIEKDTFFVEGDKINNYYFVNSVDDKRIQISDVIVAVLARFFNYVNSFQIGESTLYSIQKLSKSLRTPLQQENFCLLMKILRKSKVENELFIRINGDFVNLRALDFLLSISSVTGSGVSFKPWKNMYE